MADRPYPEPPRGTIRDDTEHGRDYFTLAQVHAMIDADRRAAPAPGGGVNEEDRKDAERYRWLRDGDLGAKYPYPVMRQCDGLRDYTIWDEELDAAIDAAIADAEGVKP